MEDDLIRQPWYDGYKERRRTFALFAWFSKTDKRDELDSRYICSLSSLYVQHTWAMGRQCLKKVGPLLSI